MAGLGAALFQTRLRLAAQAHGAATLGDTLGVYFQSPSIRIYLLALLALLAIAMPGLMLAQLGDLVTAASAGAVPRAMAIAAAGLFLFSGAASAIGVAQPALTRQIKLLEEEVGLPLVARSGRGAAPTEGSQALLDRLSPHIAGLEDTVLGMCPTIAPFFRASLEAWAAMAAPRATLSIIEAFSGDLNNLLESGRIDLALTYKSAAANGFKVTELFSERLVLVSGMERRGRSSGGRSRGPGHRP